MGLPRLTFWPIIPLQECSMAVLRSSVLACGSSSIVTITHTRLRLVMQKEASNEGRVMLSAQLPPVRCPFTRSLFWRLDIAYVGRVRPWAAGLDFPLF